MSTVRHGRTRTLPVWSPACQPYGWSLSSRFWVRPAHSAEVGTRKGNGQHHPFLAHCWVDLFFIFLAQLEALFRRFPRDSGPACLCVHVGGETGGFPL